MTGAADPLGVAEWIYFKVYLGQAVDKFDGLILETVPKILALERFERWFFLRYLDAHGVHLRLRFSFPPGTPRGSPDRSAPFASEGSRKCRISHRRTTGRWSSLAISALNGAFP